MLIDVVMLCIGLRVTWGSDKQIGCAAAYCLYDAAQRSHAFMPCRCCCFMQVSELEARKDALARQLARTREENDNLRNMNSTLEKVGNVPAAQAACRRLPVVVL